MSINEMDFYLELLTAPTTENGADYLMALFSTEKLEIEAGER